MIHSYNKEIFADNFHHCEVGIDKMIEKTFARKDISGIDRVRSRSKDAISYFITGKLSNVKIITGGDTNSKALDEIYRVLFLFIQSNSNLILLGLSNNEKESVLINQYEIEFFTKDFRNDDVGIINWIDGFLYSLIGREKNAIELLKLYPTEKARSAHFKVEDYACSYIDFLKSIDTAEANSKLLLVKEDVLKAKIATKEYIQCLIQPQLDLWQDVLNNDEVAFNKTLEQAVIKHNQYWSQEKSDSGGDSYRCNYPEGFVAMKLTGIAAYAYDKGFKITYESDYLPRFFIEGLQKIDAKVTMPN